MKTGKHQSPRRSVSIPRALLSIGEQAFLSCSRLQKGSLPDGLANLVYV